VEQRSPVRVVILKSHVMAILASRNSSILWLRSGFDSRLMRTVHPVIKWLVSFFFPLVVLLLRAFPVFFPVCFFSLYHFVITY
jgi:hypothetical protein